MRFSLGSMGPQNISSMWMEKIGEGAFPPSAVDAGHRSMCKSRASIDNWRPLVMVCTRPSSTEPCLAFRYTSNSLPRRRSTVAAQYSQRPVSRPLPPPPPHASQRCCTMQSVTEATETTVLRCRSCFQGISSWMPVALACRSSQPAGRMPSKTCSSGASSSSASSMRMKPRPTSTWICLSCKSWINRLRKPFTTRLRRPIC
mmetsp:Transcript_60711/g.198765  ORF Transcript_60711/g.198765 Transcript_60711/m.198765 type:complete len:201 (+) Transcript_60711:1971-2573(+)